MIRSRFLLPLLALLLMLTSLYASPHQAAAGETFSNGHVVKEPFLSFYRNAPDPELIFGQPITDAFERTAPKRVIVQYFERAHMEYDPTLPPDKQVVYLADIGSWLYDTTERGAPPDFPVSSSVCRSFPPDGYLVCYAFLQFYDSHNGPVYFGQPISNVEWINGRMVQYFERARMEWRSEMPEGQRVALTELGRIDFDIRIGDKSLLNPQPNILNREKIQLQALAFVEKPLLAPGQAQKVYVVVRDQAGQPVPQAQVSVSLTYQDQHPDNKPVVETDSDGVAVIEFVPDNTPPNQMIKIAVTATLGGEPAQAWTWFRTWW